MKRVKIIAMIMAVAMLSGCGLPRQNDNPVNAPALSEPVTEAHEAPVPKAQQPIWETIETEEDEPLQDDMEAVPTNEYLESLGVDYAEILKLSSQKEPGFPGGPVDELNRPSGPMSYQQKYGKYNAYYILPDSKKIFLTFDQGYENGYTTRILDILKEKEVKAVFFITYPYAQTEPELIKRMIAEGHTIGNHSTKHRDFTSITLEEAAQDLMQLHDYVLANYGYEMWLFRPPEGSFSEQTLALAQQLGYSTMLWSFAYKDYDVNNQPFALDAIANIMDKAHPGQVCLLHAVSKTNTEILGDVIDQLKARNFTFADYFYFH
ncbi:MAG: polysaccharide deacetylase family protein [Oscillospiraceae bacterium]|nr:polysaccharide deacetylase family protein [Oscillospiraceae bacterium]